VTRRFLAAALAGLILGLGVVSAYHAHAEPPACRDARHVHADRPSSDCPVCVAARMRATMSGQATVDQVWSIVESKPEDPHSGVALRPPIVQPSRAPPSLPARCF
jgi:hypothetical protein